VATNSLKSKFKPQSPQMHHNQLLPYSLSKAIVRFVLDFGASPPLLLFKITGSWLILSQYTRKSEVTLSVNISL
jgi:hypothetical protein